MYQGIGDFNYGLYILKSQGEGLQCYYLTNTTAMQVQVKLSEGQNLKWWSGYKDSPKLRIFLIAGIPGSNALIYEGFAGTKIETVALPLPPPGAEGGNWGKTWNLWTPIKVADLLTTANCLLEA